MAYLSLKLLKSSQALEISCNPHVSRGERNRDSARSGSGSWYSTIMPLYPSLNLLYRDCMLMISLLRMDWMHRSLVGDRSLPARSCCLSRISPSARCLRIMATNHIYREVNPDVFTNNRVSSLLDTLKPSAEIIAEYVSWSIRTGCSDTA